MQSDFAIVIDRKPVKHFWKGRGGFLPIAIIERMIQGSIEDAELFFDGRKPEGVFAVSAHYAIARDGRVWQFVDDEDTAWSNGVLQNPDLSIGWLKEVYQEKVNCNLVTLSIDYEGYSGEVLTPEQYQAALELHRQLVQRWEIEADDQHIIGHNWIDSLERSHNPGPSFPFGRLLKDLQAPAVAPVPVSETAFSDMPLPATEFYSPVPRMVEAETNSFYQPEAVEEPAYRPQLDAVTFTPDLNHEMNPVTAAPAEVDPTTAEPEDPQVLATQSAEPAWQIPHGLDLTEPEPVATAPESAQEPDYLADLLSTQAPEDPADSFATVSSEEAPADFVVEASSEEELEVPTAIGDLITPKTGTATVTDHFTPTEPVSMAEVFEADDEKASPPDDLTLAPVQEETAAAPEPENRLEQIEVPAEDEAATEAPVETAPQQVGSAAAFEAEQADSAQIVETKVPVQEAEVTSEAAVEAEAPVEEAASEATVEADQPEEKHHWYDKFKALFVKHEEPAEIVAESVKVAPVETAAVIEEVQPALNTSMSEIQAEPANELEATQAEITATPNEVQAELTPEPEELQAESAAESEGIQAESATVIEVPAAEGATESEEVWAEPAIESEEPAIEFEEGEVVAAPVIEAEEVEVKPATESELTVAEPATEAEAVQTTPAIEAEEVQAEVHQSQPLPVPVSQPQPVAVEESFYPFELDAPLVSNHAAFYRSEASAEPAAEATKFDFESSVPAKSFEQDYDFQDFNGPSDYPFELPAAEIRPQSSQSFTASAELPTFDTAVEKPAHLEEVPPLSELAAEPAVEIQATPELTAAPAAEEIPTLSEPAPEVPVNFQTPAAEPGVSAGLESREENPTQLSEAATTATRPLGFAYDDLELPDWLEEPASDPETTVEPAGSAETAAYQSQPGPAPVRPQSDFGWGSSPFSQEDALPGWLRKPTDQTPTGLNQIAPAASEQAATKASEPSQSPPPSASKDSPPAVALPNQDWQENLFEDDDFFSLLNQSGLDLNLNAPPVASTSTDTDTESGPLEPSAEEVSHFERLLSESGASQPPPTWTVPAAPDLPEPEFENFFDEVEPDPLPARQTIRQLIDRNDGYTAPLSYEDLDLSVPFGLEEDFTQPGQRKPLIPAQDRSDGLSFGEDFFEHEPFPGAGTPPASPVQAAPPPVQPDPPGFNRVYLGGGAVSVELANIRSQPGYAKETVLKVAEQGERFEFDGWTEGPELRGSTRWYHIDPADGVGWIHSSLVALDRPFRA